MKKFLMLILSLSLIMSLAGCSNENSSSDADSTQKAAVIEALPFPDIKISIPEDYETTSSEHIDEFYKKGSASVIVTSRPISNTTEMDGIIYDAVQQYQNIADTISEISSEDLEINGYTARILELTYSIVGEINTLSKECCLGFIIGKNNLYIITCSAPINEYAEYQEDFKAIIKSAQPLD